jgi:hypothetical protein
MGKWFCIWQFSDNRKISLNLEPKPAVVPERCASFWRKAEKIENEEITNNYFYNFNFLIWVL